MPVLLPVLLVLFAILSAAVFAYGTEPVWASFGPHGLDLIIWSRRLEWPLIVTSLLLCVALLLVVISAKRRIWWLVGLAPVLVLFSHRFTSGPAVGLSCVQDPTFVSAKDAQSEPADGRVVGLLLDDEPYAFSYSALGRSPVVVATLRDKRFILLWTSLANRALAFGAARDLRAEDLGIVSTPDDALLIYNSRLGEFINGVTGQTLQGDVPSGFGGAIPVLKTTWQQWQALHPDTKLMKGNAGAVEAATQPKYPLPGSDPTLKDTRRVCVVACTQPIAVPSEMITERPLNLTSGQTSLLLVRIDGIARAFNRELPGDLLPRFAPAADPKHKTVVWLDSDTNSEWSSAASVVEGPKEMHGVSMTPISTDDDLYWNVMKFWYPNLHLATDAELAAAVVVRSPKVVEKPVGKRRKNAPKG